MATLPEIRSLLEVAFPRDEILVKDESHKHASHYDVSPGMVSHVRIEITSDRFKGLSKPQQHRLVYEILDIPLKTGLHAVSLILKDNSEF